MTVYDGPDMNRIFKDIVKLMLASLFEDPVIMLASLFQIRVFHFWGHSFWAIF